MPVAMEHLHGLSHLGQPLLIFIFPAAVLLALLRKRRVFKWLGAVCAVLTLVGFASIFADAFLSSTIMHQLSVCRSNMKNLGTALLMYAQDWSETLPPEQSWDKAAISTIKPEEVGTAFKCPSANSPFGYGYNRALDKMKLGRVESPAETVLLLEQDAMSRNSVGDKASQPATHRHTGGNNIGFCDGHCNWTNSYSEKKLRWGPYR
jgi:prepilin-type processing-associated H-X9-DG protein